MKRALIVDDSPTVRAIIKSTLDGMGFECITAQDGVKAIKILGEQVVDIIVTDINMPNMDGITLIKELRKQRNSQFTPILVISTEGNSDIKTQGKEAGASGWIIKPFQPEVLQNAVNKLCMM